MPKKAPPTNAAMALDDTQLLAILFQPGVQGLEFTASSIMDNTDPWECLGMFARTMASISAAKRKLAPLVGRLLLKIHGKPKLYQDKGHRTFEDFLIWVDKEYGLARTDSYDCMMIVKCFPDLPLERYGKIGKSKMRLLAQFTKQGEPSAEKYLQRAESMTYTKFHKWCTEYKLVENDFGQRSSIVIECGRDLDRLWRWFSGLGSVQSYVGSKDPAQIFESCLQECMGSWGITEECVYGKKHEVEANEECVVGIDTPALSELRQPEGS